VLKQAAKIDENGESGSMAIEKDFWNMR